VVTVTNLALGIDYEDCRHAPQLKQVNFLVELVGDARFDVGAADERNRVLSPIFAEGIWAVRTEGNDLGSTRLKLGIILAQLCQVLAAVRSHKTAQQNQYHRAPAIVAQTDGAALGIGQFEIGGGLAHC